MPMVWARILKGSKSAILTHTHSPGPPDLGTAAFCWAHSHPGNVDEKVLLQMQGSLRQAPADPVRSDKMHALWQSLAAITQHLQRQGGAVGGARYFASLEA